MPILAILFLGALLAYAQYSSFCPHYLGGSQYVVKSSTTNPVGSVNVDSFVFISPSSLLNYYVWDEAGEIKAGAKNGSTSSAFVVATVAQVTTAAGQGTCSQPKVQISGIGNLPQTILVFFCDGTPGLYSASYWSVLPTDNPSITSIVSVSSVNYLVFKQIPFNKFLLVFQPVSTNAFQCYSTSSTDSPSAPTWSSVSGCSGLVTPKAGTNFDMAANIFNQIVLAYQINDTFIGVAASSTYAPFQFSMVTTINLGAFVSASGTNGNDAVSLASGALDNWVVAVSGQGAIRLYQCLSACTYAGATYDLIPGEIGTSTSQTGIRLGFSDRYLISYENSTDIYAYGASSTPTTLSPYLTVSPSAFPARSPNNPPTACASRLCGITLAAGTKATMSSVNNRKASTLAVVRSDNTIYGSTCFLAETNPTSNAPISAPSQAPTRSPTLVK